MLTCEDGWHVLCNGGKSENSKGECARRNQKNRIQRTLYGHPNFCRATDLPYVR